MPRIEHKNTESQPQKRIYSEIELQAIDRDLTTNFLCKYTLRDGTDVEYIDYVKYHQKNGGISPSGAVIVEVDEFNEPLTPTKYELIEERLRQYAWWKSRKEYGTKKYLEHLDTLKDSFSIPPNKER